MSGTPTPTAANAALLEARVVEIPVVLRTGLRGVPQAVGVLTAGIAASHFEVPHRDSPARRGYQRPPQMVRVRKLKTALRLHRVDLPTAVLFNLRDFQESDLIEQHGRLALRLDLDSLVLLVVDGQHRMLALAELVHEQPEEWAGFELSFVCMLGANEQQEMEEFYVVNSTAKSVRTDLAYDLLRERAHADPEVMTAAIESGDQWKVDGQTLTEELARRSVWKGRIRFPGQPAAGSTIGSAGMVTSLKALLGNSFFGSIAPGSQVDVLEAYWQGIAKVLPEPFIDPSIYALQKSTGVQAMHAVLLTVIEWVRAENLSVIDPQSYADGLQEALLHLQGDTASGMTAEGADFWRSGPDGAAGSYSSNAGRRVLIARIKSVVPEIRIR